MLECLNRKVEVKPALKIRGQKPTLTPQAVVQGIGKLYSDEVNFLTKKDFTIAHDFNKIGRNIKKTALMLLK